MSTASTTTYISSIQDVFREQCPELWDIEYINYFYRLRIFAKTLRDKGIKGYKVSPRSLTMHGWDGSMLCPFRYDRFPSHQFAVVYFPPEGFILAIVDSEKRLRSYNIIDEDAESFPENILEIVNDGGHSVSHAYGYSEIWSAL